MKYIKLISAIDKYVKEYYENNIRQSYQLNNKKNANNINDWNDILSVVIRKSVLQYLIRKNVGFNKDVSINNSGIDNTDTITKCLKNKYKNIVVEDLDKWQNMLRGKINRCDKLINFTEYNTRYIEFRYKDINNLINLLKLLSKYKIIPKIDDVMICNSNKRFMYYIVIYDNYNKNYKQLNKENVKKLSESNKIILNKNIEKFIKKLIHMKILNNTFYDIDVCINKIKELKKYIFFDDKLNVVFIFTDDIFPYNLNNYSYINSDYKKIIKTITKNIISEGNYKDKEYYIDVKRYVIGRLLRDKLII